MHAMQRVTREDVVAYGFLVDEDEQAGTTRNRFVQLFHSAEDVRKAMSCMAPEVQVLVCDRAFEVSPLNLAAALHKDAPQRDIYLEKDEPQALFISRVEAAGARGVVSRAEARQLLDLYLDCPSAESAEASATESEGIPPSEPTTGPMTVPMTVPTTGSTTGPTSLPAVEPAAPPTTGQMTGQDPTEWVQTGQAPGATPLSPSSDLDWLEQVLELDELDDIPQTAKTTVMEQPALRRRIAPQNRVGPRSAMAGEQLSEGKGIVAAFISGRGGVGKSSLTVLSALDLWLAGSQVALLDMDLQFGDLGVLAGNEPDVHIQRLAVEQLCNSRMRIPSPREAMLLLEAPQNPELAEELVHQVPGMLAALRSVADIVLVNTSCLWNETAAVLASSADKLVVCMDQRATSISAARQVVDLCIRLKIPSTRLCYLLNRCARNAPITDIDASLAMGGVEVITIAEGGADVDELLSLGCPYELLTSKSSLRQCIKDLGARLLANPGDTACFEGASAQ